MASGYVNRARRPNTWLHRPALRREDSPCQLGARIRRMKGYGIGQEVAHQLVCYWVRSGRIALPGDVARTQCELISRQPINSEYTGFTLTPTAAVPKHEVRTLGSYRDHFASSSLRALSSDATQDFMTSARVAASCCAAMSRQAPAMSSLGGPGDAAPAVGISVNIASRKAANGHMLRDSTTG
jgi:hypothetical protein